MVLGLGQKTRKSPSVRLDYIIHIQDIKPWPPSQSLRSLRAVVIQWEYGDKSSGSTSPVIPALGTGTNDGKIEFNETFRLPVTLLRDTSVRSGGATKFQKNCLELNLYELRRDKTSKGQLLGTAIIDLADHGVIRESTTVSTTMNCQRNFRNTAQPILCVKIHPASRGRVTSSSMDNTSIQALLDKNDGESVSALMKEEYAEEAERSSFIEDDASSQSSATVPCTPSDLSNTSPLKRELVCSFLFYDN